MFLNVNTKEGMESLNKERNDKKNKLNLSGKLTKKKNSSTLLWTGNHPH